MIRSFYTAVSGMITQEAKQDVLTNNIANANTVGFKQDDLSVGDFGEMLLQNYDKVVGGKNVRNVIGDISLGSRVNGVNSEFSSGTIQDTGIATDFAIDGRGFFAVSRQEGNGNTTYYTRDGHFHVNINGILVDDAGDTVLARNTQTGALGPVDVGNGKMVCDSQGNISIDGTQRYKLDTVDFNDYNALTKVGDNLYSGNGAVESNAVNVKQNSLESSNVNVVNAMADMLTTMRTFETNQKAVQSIDETLDKLVNEVGRV
ncbi:MAG: flagellar basal body rod protein FlgG [Clostridium sp.]|jgi:flagellar basal-body rod protein FlgG|uniref:flagellar basal-body rod protein FlgG n=1 Tax=Clostridium sp. TaxID=1506 RepID=UPI0025B9CC46|nr:flagellar basal-body rod protein FlgG [Clostridium sp.]MCH3964204.1 flagellar basal body rod protein FlgG [Clostridium sp.]MCI1715385.1 flagellar basal body rod protein FlgG [Clostridium sp.]MCI1799824.1 flagellar basal body rod protein FlgG [Clostridium sp.]MCI1813568.1 flagellar basal body rod protein FlgG [Clostridium sp.]MCI1870642.1 flagellar basal body rod protein FlgG [Clostridium sp.]